jgi:hypothetical protein
MAKIVELVQAGPFLEGLPDEVAQDAEALCQLMTGRITDAVLALGLFEEASAAMRATHEREAGGTAWEDHRRAVQAREQELAAQTRHRPRTCGTPSCPHRSAACARCAAVAARRVQGLDAVRLAVRRGVGMPWAGGWHPPVASRGRHPALGTTETWRCAGLSCRGAAYRLCVQGGRAVRASVEPRAMIDAALFALLVGAVATPVSWWGISRFG